MTLTNLVPLLTSRMDFSYNQFMVFSADLDLAELAMDWTQEHVDQGFARRKSIVSFSTITQYGQADLNVYLARFEDTASYQRVIAVPFYSPIARVVICGPEEVGSEHFLTVETGYYRLIEAQKLLQPHEYTGDLGHIAVDLYFELVEKPLETSQIIVCDSMLSPPRDLLEYAELY